MVSFKINDCGEFLSVYDVRVVCRKSSFDLRYFYVLEACAHGSPNVFLDLGCFYTPDEAFEVVEYIQKIYPYLFENGKNVDYLLDMDFYPEFSAEAVKERNDKI